MDLTLADQIFFSVIGAIVLSFILLFAWCLWLQNTPLPAERALLRTPLEPLDPLEDARRAVRQRLQEQRAARDAARQSL